jgi:hypothetical protein
MFLYAASHGKAAGHAVARSLFLLTGQTYFMRESQQRHAARSTHLLHLAMKSIVIYVYKKQTQAAQIRTVDTGHCLNLT